MKHCLQFKVHGIVPATVRCYPWGLQKAQQCIRWAGTHDPCPRCRHSGWLVSLGATLPGGPMPPGCSSVTAGPR